MIFISYSSRDSLKARELEKLCNVFDVPVFLAELSLQGGTKWKDEILARLNASEIFIVLLSASSIRSDAVQHEIGAALSSKKLILPILLDLKTSQIPEWISDIQAIRFEEFDEAFLEKKIRKLNKGTGFLWTIGIVGIALLFMKKTQWMKAEETNRKREFLREKIVELHSIADQLTSEFSGKKFTIDGRLVGDIGETIAELDYDIVTFEKLKKDLDAVSRDGKKVQIKVTFKDKIGFKCVDEHFLALKFETNGEYTEIYNGPARYILQAFASRKGIGKTLQPLPINDLRRIGELVPVAERVARRGVTF